MTDADVLVHASISGLVTVAVTIATFLAAGHYVSDTAANAAFIAVPAASLAICYADFCRRMKTHDETPK